MSWSLTPALFGLVMICVFCEAARELCFKYVADKVSFGRILLQPIIWLGIIFWVAELIIWTYLLERLPLSVAFPLISLSYIAIVAAGAVFFKEKVNRRHALGALLITAGVACVGANGI